MVAHHLSSAIIKAGGKNHLPQSSRQWLQTIFVMQSGEDRRGDHAVAAGM